MNTMLHDMTGIKALPWPTVKRLLREAGFTMTDVARQHGCDPSVVSRVVRHKAASDPVWRTIARMLRRRSVA